jgi:hypothetical protein
MTHINAYHAAVQEAELEVKEANAKLENAQRDLCNKQIDLGLPTDEKGHKGNPKEGEPSSEDRLKAHEELPENKEQHGEERPSQQVEKAKKEVKH